MKTPPRMLNGLPLTARDYRLLADYACGGGTCRTLEDASPVWTEDGADVAEAVVDALFCSGGEDPWLRCGDGAGIAWEGRRTSLRSRLGDCEWIVPNSTGGLRRWLVIGFSFRFEVDGGPGPDAEVLAALRRNGRHVADLCAAALLDLAKIAPLALVVAGGSDRLLEGWFFCQGVDPAVLRKFMGKAMQVGAADSVCDFVPHYLRPYQEEGWLAAWQSGLRMLAGVKHWKPLAPVMMPGGRTADGEYQAVKFFSPEVVKA